MTSEFPPPPPSPPPVMSQTSVSLPHSAAAIAASVSLPSNKSSSSSFGYKISEKLADNNFLLWLQQVEPAIKANRLHHFLVSPKIPSQFLSEQYRIANRVNLEYLDWEQVDQMVLSWIQFTLSSSVMSHILGLVHAFGAWEKIHTYFHHQTQAKARQLRSELRTVSLDDRNVSEFLQRIKSIVDSLASIGDPVSSQGHLDSILECLPQEFDLVISLIESRIDPPMTIEEAEGLILAQELRIKKYRKKSSVDLPSVNLTQDSSSQPKADASGKDENRQANTAYTDTRGDGGYRGHGGAGFGRFSRGRGRDGRSSLQCQVCFRIGHTAANCYHRFNPHYQPPPQQSLPYPQNTWTLDSAQSQFHLPRPPQQFQQPQPPTQQLPSQVQPQAMVAHSASAPAQHWYPTSGASFHVIGQSQNIKQVSPFEGPDQIFVGNGKGFE